MDDTRVSCSFILKMLLRHLTHAVTLTRHAKRRLSLASYLRNLVTHMYSGISAETSCAISNRETCLPHDIRRIEVRIECISVEYFREPSKRIILGPKFPV